MSTFLYSPHLNLKLSLELDDKTERNPLGRAEKLPDLPFPLSPCRYVGQAWWCWSYGFGRMVCAGRVTRQLAEWVKKPLSLNYQPATVRSQKDRAKPQPSFQHTLRPLIIIAAAVYNLPMQAQHTHKLDTALARGIPVPQQ